MRARIVGLCLLIALATSGVAWASHAAEPLPEGAPARHVKFGLFVTQLGDFDLPRRSFSVVFWAWFLHTMPDYKPVEHVEVVNAKSMMTRYPSTTRIEDAPFEGARGPVLWDQAKYFATVSQDWDVANYPFDRQTLRINLEDSESDTSELILEPDALTPSLMDESVRIPGWSIESMAVTGRDQFYRTDYGNPTLNGSSTFSRVVVDIVVHRHGWRLLSSMFIGFFVAFALSSASYMLEASGPIANARVGLSGGAIFASVGNKYVIDNNLPPAASFTLADGIEASTFVAILFAILASVAVMTLKPARPAAAARLNRLCGFGSAALYLAFNAAMIARAIAG